MILQENMLVQMEVVTILKVIVEEDVKLQGNYNFMLLITDILVNIQFFNFLVDFHSINLPLKHKNNDKLNLYLIYFYKLINKS
jgi:hypothetical protein